MTPFHFINAVWGERFTRVYLDLVLPAQFAPGNLPALRRRGISTYKIYTTETDAETIRASAAYHRLASLMRCEIRVIDRGFLPLLPKVNPCLTMSRLQKDAIREAGDGALVFLAPDAVLSDGALGAIENRVDQGAEAIMMCALRLTLEEAAPVFAGRIDGGALAMSGAELCDLILRHPHPITLGTLWGTERFHNSWPAPLLWRDPDAGLVAHAWHPHPILMRVRPGSENFLTTIDGDFMAGAVGDSGGLHMITDSDEAAIVELSRRDHMADTLEQAAPFDPAKFERWLKEVVTPVHRRFAEIPFRFRASGGTRSALETLEREARTVLATVNRAPADHVRLDSTGLTAITELRDLPAVYLYGTGESGRTIRRLIGADPRIAFRGFIDSFRSGTLDGDPILRLDEFLAVRRPDDVVVICSMHDREIGRTLKNAGVDRWLNAGNLFEVTRLDAVPLRHWPATPI